MSRSSQPSQHETRPNPYVGPRAFQRGETLYGRAQEVLELTGLLASERIVLFCSPSGAGKTSLIQAALIPKLQQEGFHILPPMRVGLDPPDLPLPVANRYVFSLLLSLEETRAPDKQAPLAELAALTFADYLGRLEAAADGPDFILLIFDQFEEILTIDPTDRAVKARFFEQVGQALRDRRRWALFAMREEFLGGLDPYLRALPTRLRTAYRLDLLGPSAALEAIQQPAQQAGVEFTDAAAIKLVDDLRQVRVQQANGSTEAQPGLSVEPVQLQVVCRRLWNRLPPGATQILPKELGAVGDVDTALAGYYAERVAAIAATTGIRERAIRDWVQWHLITEQGIRGQVLQGHEQSQGLENRAIWPLVDAHLVRAEKRRGATWFELAHDRLIEPLRADNAVWGEAHLSTLQRRAALWESHKRANDLLVRGQALVEAEAWAEVHCEELTSVEHDFLAVCREDRERLKKEARQTRRIRWLAVGATVLAAVAIILSIVAWIQADKAQEARTAAWAAAAAEADAKSTADSIADAERDARRAADHARETAVAEGERAEQQSRVARSRALAAQAQSVFLEAPQRGLLLAVEATINTLRPGDPHVIGGEQALRDALGRAGGIPIAAHPRSITSVAFSPDGRWLATAGLDNTARLWDLEAADLAAEPRILSGHEDWVTGVAFSPDGRWLATTSVDSTARLWDLRAPDPVADPRVLRGHPHDVQAVAFSPDGRWLATAGGEDFTARLWDLQVRDPAAMSVVLRGHSGGVTSVQFSPDGRWLATGSDDGTARLWDLEAASPAGSNPGAALMILGGHVSPIYSVAFSPDGHWLVTGCRDGTARVWDLQAGDPATAPLVLRGHEGYLNAVAFSQDGHWLATGSGDRTARLWNLQARDPYARPQVLRSHDGSVTSVAFSLDGRWLATGSWDGTARLWDLRAEGSTADPLVLRGQESVLYSVAFGPSGRWLAAGGRDGTVCLWDLQTRDPVAEPAVLHGQEDRVTAVAFSPDGRWLAVGSTDQIVRLWDLQGVVPAAPRELRGHESSIHAVAFSPDGRWLASGSWDGTIRLWDLRAEDPALAPLVLRGHEGYVYSVAFSPTGRWLASGSSDHTTRLWDLQARDPAAGPRVLRGHRYGVYAVAFGPYGRWLATGSSDYTARLWDLQTGDSPAASVVLRGHEDNVNSVAFSPDGRWLATGSADDTVRLWNLQGGDPAAEPLVLAGHGDAVTSVAFSPDGRWLATGSFDASARVWGLDLDYLVALACRSAGRNLTPEEWARYMGAGEPYRKTCPNLPAGE